MLQQINRKSECFSENMLTHIYRKKSNRNSDFRVISNCSTLNDLYSDSSFFELGEEQKLVDCITATSEKCLHAKKARKRTKIGTVAFISILEDNVDC